MSLLKANAVQLGQSLTATNNFTLYQPATPDGTVRLGNGNSGSVTDLVTLTSAGNLGIGTSSPSTKLTVYDASTPQVTFNNGTSSFIVGNNNGGNNHILYGTGAYPIIFYTNSAEAMRLDSSGNLGLGVTPSANYATIKTLQVGALGATVITGNTSAGGTSVFGQNLYFDVSTAVQRYAASSYASSYNQYQGTHQWFTAPSGTAGNAISFTQAMTLDASGNLLVGTTSGPAGGARLRVVNNVTNIWDFGPNTGSSFVVYNPSQVGVYISNGNTSWTSTSDERLKENLIPIENAVSKVSTLRAVTGNFIADEEKRSRPFLIAQDVQAVLPEAVDASDPDKLGVQYTDTIPLLVAAIKELSAELNELKQKVK